MKSIIAASIALGIAGGLYAARRPAVKPVGPVARQDASAGLVVASASFQASGQPPSMAILINGIDTGHTTSEFQWVATVGESARRWTVANPKYTTLETYAELTVNAPYRR